ncbi:MAG TPA: LysR substrate-binding domain-containing protein [Sphingobium sp.]|nr:LysR substrate-binding domain-containing protein [Sphingobium sp.]
MTQAFRFDLVDLRLFINIAECDSLSRGAERSNLSLPAASTRIKNLEINLGTQLFTRTSRGVSLTPPGQTFLHHARLAIQQLVQLNADLSQFSKGVRGKLRLAANVSSMVDLVPTAIRNFLATHDGVEVELKQYTSPEGLQAVADGSVDLALVVWPVQDKNLEAVPLIVERFVLVTPKGHPLSRQAAANFEEIFDYELIGLGDANTKHPHFTRFASAVNKTLSYRIHVNNFEDVCRLVSDGLGIAAIPESMASRYAPIIPIEIIPISDNWAIRQISLCMRKPRMLPDFVYDMADVIEATAKEREAVMA